MKFHRLAFSIFITGFICGIMGYATGCSTTSVLHNKQQIDEAATIRKRVLSQTAPDPWSMSREEILAEMKARYPNAKAHLSFGQFINSMMDKYISKEDRKALLEAGGFYEKFSYSGSSSTPAIIIYAVLTREPPFSLQSIRKNLQTVRSYDYLDDERLAISRFIAENIFDEDQSAWLAAIENGLLTNEDLQNNHKIDPGSLNGQ